MTEERRRQRAKGQLFRTEELESFLTAYGDDLQPLPATVRLLDELVTDFVIEICHAAAQPATYTHRAKVKVDDFKFALRKDADKLGKVSELLRKEKEIKRNRKAFDVEDEAVAREKEGVDGGDGRGKGKGKRRKKGEADEPVKRART